VTVALTPAMTERAAAGLVFAPFACLGGMAAALALGAAALPHLPVVAVLILLLMFGLAAGVPLAANAAVARGHALKTKNPANPLHRLLRSGVLRVLLFGALGICAASILLVRLAVGGAPAWLGAGAGAGAALAVMVWGGGVAARLNAPVHDAAGQRRAAFWFGVLASALVSGLAGWLLGPGVPALSRSAASALVAEAFEAHRLLDGVIAWVLGAVTALGLLPAWAEALLAVAVFATSGAAVAALTVAALMPAQDWARAFGIASDEPQPPPPHRPALLAAAALAGLGVAGALWADAWLSAQDPSARPVAQLQIGVERIGTAFHLPGTHAQISAGRNALAVADAAALLELRILADTGFDAMAARVDPFLDGYYSLDAEYLRIGVALLGWLDGDAEAAMEAHLKARLEAALDSETHLRAMTERLAGLGLAEASAEHDARETALLAAPVTGINPARLRLEAEFPPFAPLPELQSSGLASSLEVRLGGSVAVGVLGAVVARRVLQRLIQQGVLRLGARAILASVPLLGALLTLGADAAAVRLEEYFNRADFRAEILEALEEQRAEVLQILDAAAGALKGAYVDSPAGQLAAH
jgi:hypothetical protein